MSGKERKLARLKSLLGEAGSDLDLEDLDDSIINELMGSVGGSKTNFKEVNANIDYSSIHVPKKKAGTRSYKKEIKDHESMIDEEWKWREPTDDENETDRDDGGGLTLKVHSSILDESVNISNLNVSFNAALQSRSQSAVARKKAERHKQKVNISEL